MPRLIKRVYDQIPSRIRGRFLIRIESDPYHLHAHVIARTGDGHEYSSGPIEVEWRHDKLIKCDLPDWYIAHLCSLPPAKNQLMQDLWDSLAEEGVEWP